MVFRREDESSLRKMLTEYKQAFDDCKAVLAAYLSEAISGEYAGYFLGETADYYSFLQSRFEYASFDELTLPEMSMAERLRQRRPLHIFIYSRNSHTLMRSISIIQPNIEALVNAVSGKCKATLHKDVDIIDHREAGGPASVKLTVNFE